VSDKAVLMQGGWWIVQCHMLRDSNTLLPTSCLHCDIQVTVRFCIL